MKTRDIEGFAEAPTAFQHEAAIIDLSEFLASAGTLSADQRTQIVDAALFLIDDIYVHLPLKEAMHAIDPVQRLKLLRRRVGTLNERRFHDEMISIFKNLRDLHTNYILPVPYRNHTAFLPFLMEEFYDDTETRHYLVSRLLVGFTHPTFVPGVEVTHWNGAPVDMAVAENADREAGSNLPARHVRGLDAMTVRPMAMSLPPIEEWVMVGYTDLTGTQQELRLPWQVFRPDAASGSITPIAEGLDADEVISASGLDLNQELTNRARLALFVEGAAQRRLQGASLYQGGTSGDAKLETLLAETDFTYDLRRRAADLRRRLVAGAISKYAVGRGATLTS